MKTALATSTLTGDLDTRLATLRRNFAAHLRASYATAHQSLPNILGGAYQDSHGDHVGTRLLSVTLGDITYYVPCTLVIGDAPTA